LPAPHQSILILLNYVFNSVQLGSFESLVLLKSRWRQPVFRLASIALDMHVRWLVLVSCIKKETVRANSKHSRHGVPLRSPGFKLRLEKLNRRRQEFFIVWSQLPVLNEPIPHLGF